MNTFPWVPLYTIERSNQAEVTVYGVISIIDAKGKPVFSVGNDNHVLWTRSCLKPWQLLAHLPVLQSAYPELQPHHFALMLSSHSAEAVHLNYLGEIAKIGKVSLNCLQCPPGYPMSQEAKIKLKEDGMPPHSMYNGCSGKHMGYLLAMQASGLDLSNYLDVDGEQFDLLRQLLGWQLNKSAESFPTTIDGCRLPNYSIPIRELAVLYCQLLSGLPSDKVSSAPASLKPILANWHHAREFMSKYPEIVGGKGRTDTRIMSGEFTDKADTTILAKQGADGLLALSVESKHLNQAFGQHLGIVIKIASGSEPRTAELVAKQLFTELGLRAQDEPDAKNQHLKTRFHFSLQGAPIGQSCS